MSDLLMIPILLGSSTVKYPSDDTVTFFHLSKRIPFLLTGTKLLFKRK